MDTRAQEVILDDTRSWARSFTQWLLSRPAAATWTIGGKERRIAYRILGIRSDGKYVQLPPRWRDRLRAAGLDEEWNVIDPLLWEHAVWQVETTGVFRPERQEGLHDLVTTPPPHQTDQGSGGPKNVPHGTKQEISTSGELSLSETIMRALKR